jgi:hypothetical protein
MQQKGHHNILGSFFGLLLINSYLSCDNHDVINTPPDTIKVLYTSALIPQQYAMRKNEYIHSINVLNNYGYSPYIVEAYQHKPPSFFEEYSNDVFYAGTHDPHIRNKGVLEALSLLAYFKKCNFNNNDMIIKLTGRYYFSDDSFFKLIENNPDKKAFIKLDQYGQVFGGCYALNYVHFKKMFEQLNVIKMENHMINLEYAVAQYIKQMDQEEVMYVDRIGIVANVFGKGACHIMYS